MGRRLLVAGLLALALAAVVTGLAASWRLAGPDVELGVHGWIAIALAFGLTGALGGGLMWLAFYSSRRGWDDIDRDL